MSSARENYITVTKSHKPQGETRYYASIPQMKCTPHTQLDKILHSPREFIKGDTKIIINELVVAGMLTPWIALLCN